MTRLRFSSSRAPRRRLRPALVLSAVLSVSRILLGAAHADVGPAPVASGTAHACALLDDGTVRCWGSNDLGELGAAPANPTATTQLGVTTESQPPPVAKPLGSCDEDFDCPSGHCDPGTHACSCTSGACPFASACSGGVCVPAVAGPGCACPWGYACSAGACAPIAASALAIPQVPSATSPAPGVPAPLLGNVIALAAGDAHTCALVGAGGAAPGGSVWCWGENSAGQLGAGDFDTHSLPVQVAGIAGAQVPAIAIAAGAFHTCALLADGTVACWGDDNQLQLGGAAPGGGPANRNTPIAVPGVTGATAIAAGADHTCARIADGSVTCWGGNASGQAGVSGGAPVTAPATVSGLSGAAIAIAAGRLHTCALVVERAPDATSVQCWGDNASAQLGNGSTTGSAHPSSVSGVHGVRGISAGGDHACAVRTDGTVTCWGDNSEGQTGNGHPGKASTLHPDTAYLATGPTAVPGLSRVRAISSGAFHNCAVLDDGTLTCWGSDAHGQLGDNAISLTASGAPGTAANFGGAAPDLVSAGLQIASGYFHHCVLGADGRTRCWGGPAGEALGTGSSLSAFAPVTATVLPVCGASGSPACAGAISMCGGSSYTCSLLSDGTVWCWGEADHGELGNGATPSTPAVAPVQAGLGGPAVQIACGILDACALRSDGTVQCWGDNSYGVLGNGSLGGIDATPGTVLQAPGAPLDGVASIATSVTGDHTCALRGDGSIYCWGYALVGQIGANFDRASFPYQPYAAPISLSNGRIAKALTLGAYHSCALASDGTAQCWGDDFDGAVGDSNPDPAGNARIWTPTPVSGFTWAVSITGGYETTCAVRGDGSVWCWGDNVGYGSGAVGNADIEAIRAPASVVTQSGAPLFGACVSAGFYSACALRPDGTADCWGNDGWGSLGNGNTGSPPNDSFPYAVPVASSAPLTR